MLHLGLQAPHRMQQDRLMLSLDQLRQALDQEAHGRYQEWAATVGDVLLRVETALRQHRVAAKSPNGPLAEVDETRPTLARQVDGLRSDHDDFIQDIVALREEVRRTDEEMDVGAIRELAEHLLTGLQNNWDAETRLILESFN